MDVNAFVINLDDRSMGPFQNYGRIGAFNGPDFVKVEGPCGKLGKQLVFALNSADCCFFLI